MVFSSLLFLYCFFPLSMGLYAICRKPHAKNMVLLISSLIFYAWGEPKYLFLLMFMAFSSWICALRIAKTEAKGKAIHWVILNTVVDIGLIGYFKYAGLICSIFGTTPDFIKNIALPIGISFYTFQLLTYVVDVYRGDAPAQESYWNVLLYAALFHQCVAGPIVRYKTVEYELFGQTVRKPELKAGVLRFSCGLAKKVLLANPCGALAETLLLSTSTIADPSLLTSNIEALQNLSIADTWLGIFAYSLHIFLDFSAYSDMAIGMGLMIGLHYLENFNYPYISRTVTEFWRRWHISLGSFFRDYVYIPLGGSRCSKSRMVLNTFLVWLLTGLWHGASWNFIVWGLWFFLFLMLERFFLKGRLDKIPVISNIYLLVIVMVGWVLFRFTNLELAWVVIKGMFGANGNPLSSFHAEIQFKSHVFLLIGSIVVSTPLIRWMREKIEQYIYNHKNLAVIWETTLYSVLPVVLLLLSTACLVGDSYNPFIYFQF